MKPFAALDQRGFTILECFAAMVLFALGILALTRLHMATIQANASAQQLTQATILAQKTVEDLMARAYQDAMLNVSPPRIPPRLILLMTSITFLGLLLIIHP